VKSYTEIDHKHIYTLKKFFSFESAATNMAAARSFDVICEKFSIDKISRFKTTAVTK
jgi:hypothetical protein